MAEILWTIYPWVKALHVISVIAWMAGLFYLPRLFVYHAERVGQVGETHELFMTMELKLLRVIMNPAMTGQFTPQGCKGIIGINHRHPRRPQAGKHFTLGPRHTFQVTKPFQVCRSGIGNDGNRWLCDSGKIINLARMIRAHLQHCKLIILTETGQRQRQARRDPVRGDLAGDDDLPQ